MQKSISTFYLLLFVSVIGFMGCEEIPPDINPIMNQVPCEGVEPSTVDGQTRHVLVEEFTGVECVNCPAGSQMIEDLLALHGERLVAVSIHAGEFSDPLSVSAFDFRTPAANNLLNFLGTPLFYPTGVVDRRLFDGEPRLQVGAAKWAGYISEELAKPVQVRINLETQYDETTRELAIESTAFFQETMNSTALNLSIFITENNVVDGQDTNNGIVEDYVHKHVFRDAVTNVLGNPLMENPLAGDDACLSYTYTLPVEYDAAEVAVVAFVHLADDPKDVLQVVEKKIK